MTSRLWIAIAVCAFSGLASEAQVVFRPGGGRGVNVQHPGAWWGAANYYGGSFVPGYGGYTGSTPAESFARGQAELMRAQGDAYRAAAAGTIDYEQARRTYMENQQRWHEIQLQRQKMGEQQRAERYAAQRAARERRAVSQPATPAPSISDAQYDPNSGEVSWPQLLQQEVFADERNHLEELLKLRAHTGGTTDVNQQILESATALRTELKLRIRELPPTDYIESRKFLDVLINEVRPFVG